MKDYDKNKESLSLKCWDVTNLYSWAMSQTLPVNDFKQVEDISEFNKDFVKSYNDESDEGCFLEVDVQYPKNLNNLHNELPFLPKRTKIQKVEKLVANLNDKEEYDIHMGNLKQALNDGLLLKKARRDIKFNQTAWSKSYIGMKTELRKIIDIQSFSFQLHEIIINYLIILAEVTPKQ